MGKECGAWVSRRLWGGSNTSPLETTAWEASRNKDIRLELCDLAFQAYATRIIVICLRIIFFINHRNVDTR